MQDLAASRYEKRRLLGQGAMGRVYLVHDPLLGREVALKEVLDPSVGLAEFKQEFWWMTRLRHPNLVEVFDFGRSDLGHPFFTMEVVAGAPLDQLLPLGPEAAREVLKQLCRVLGHLHVAGLVHGDIKPENMRLLDDGTLKLMDFGLMTQAGQVVGVRGTPAYMAPEVIRGARVDRRADLYALGVLAYQLLTGRLPFEAATQGAMLEAHLEAPAPSLAIAGLEATWDQVVARLLEKEPVRRFQSAREVLAALGESAAEDDADLLFPPFVGREVELAAFEQALGAVGRDRRTASLTIAGGTGLGKSRLLDEFAYRAQLGHCLILRGVAGAAGGLPYEAFRQVLQQAWPLLAIEEGPKALLAASLRTLAPDLAAAPIDERERMEPQQEKQRMQGALADVLRHLAKRQGLVLLLDAWQDADPLSVELLGVMKRQLAGEPLLIAMATRRADAPEASPLAPLSGPDIARMVGAMLGEEQVSEAFWGPIAEISGGVPEVAEALLRHLVEQRVLPREGGRWRLEALDAAALPSGVQEILASRLAELTPVGRRILELAGVMAGEFATALLVRLLPDVPAETLDDELALLVQKQLVVQHRDQVRAAQPAMGAALCGGLGEERLRALHTLVAEALEETLESEGAASYGADGLVMRVAHHFLAGRRQAKAVLYALKAAQRAEGLLANDLAMDFATRGWAWLEDPAVQADGLASLRPEYLCLMGDLHRRKGDFAEATRCYEAALPLADQHGRADLEAHMRVGGGVLKQMQKDVAGALALYEQALPLCQALENPREELRCLTTMGRTYYQGGHEARAEVLFEQALARARAVGNTVFEAESLAFLGLIWASGKTEPGRPSRVDEGLEMFQRAIAVKQGIGDKLGLNDTYMLLGNAQLKLGDLAGAADSFARNGALCEETGALDDGVFAHLNLTIVGVEQGDPAFALARCAQALALAGEIKADFSWGLAKSLEGWVLAHLGRTAEALAAHAEALGHARRLKNDYLALFAQVYGVEIALAFGQWEAAREALDEALRLQSEGGVSEYANALTLGAARLDLMLGKLDEARRGFEGLLEEAEGKGWKLLAAQAAYGLARCERRTAESIALATEAARLAEAAGALALLGESRLLLSCGLEAGAEREGAQAAALSALAIAERWGLADLLARASHRCAVLQSPSARSNRLIKQAQEALAGQVEGLSAEDGARFIAAHGRLAIQAGDLSSGTAQAGQELSSLKHRVGEVQEVAELFRAQRDFARLLQRVEFAPEAMAQALSLVLTMSGASRAEILVKEGKQLVSALRQDAAAQAPCPEEWGEYMAEIEQAMALQTPRRGPAPGQVADRSIYVLPLSVHTEGDGVMLLVARAGVLERLTPEGVEALGFAVETLAHALRAVRAKSEAKRITERFQMLNELGRAVGSSLELEQVLRVLLEQTLTLTQANLAYVILPEAETLACRYGLNVQGERVTGLDISYTLANRVLRSREPLCILDTGAEEDTQTASVLALNLQSVMCVPLIVKDELVGLLYVSSNFVSRTFTQQDLDLLIAIAGQTALSVQNALYLAEMEKKKHMEAELGRIGQEMEIATRIQTALLPNDLTIEGFELAMELRTATEVGGDLIDYVPQADGRFWLAVGDVTGHGLTPGLIMMMTQSIFSGLAMTDASLTPRELLIRLNRALYHNVRNRLQNDNYLTLQLIRHAGDGHFTMAGLHCDILVYRAAEQRVECLESPGFWTGFLPDVEEMTEQQSFHLAPHDVLLLYTDGLIEARNAERVQYDMARLEDALARYAALPVDAIKAKILDEVNDWLVTVDDDISIVVLKRQA